MRCQVGYGDKVPVTILGRLIACLWMIAGIILFGYFNASIVMSMAGKREPVNLSGPRDKRLRGLPICTTYGAFEEYMADHSPAGSSIVYESDVSECYKKLKHHEV